MEGHGRTEVGPNLQGNGVERCQREELVGLYPRLEEASLLQPMMIHSPQTGACGSQRY